MFSTTIVVRAVWTMIAALGKRSQLHPDIGVDVGVAAARVLGGRSRCGHSAGHRRWRGLARRRLGAAVVGRAGRGKIIRPAPDQQCKQHGRKSNESESHQSSASPPQCSESRRPVAALRQPSSFVATLYARTHMMGFRRTPGLDERVSPSRGDAYGAALSKHRRGALARSGVGATLAGALWRRRGRGRTPRGA